MIDQDSPAPRYSIGLCPVCVDGLCSVRVCLDENGLRGLVICDECEAVWLEPDLESPHLVVDPVSPVWPEYHHSLWGPYTHWADLHEIEQLGWQHAIKHSLDFYSQPLNGDEEE